MLVDKMKEEGPELPSCLKQPPIKEWLSRHGMSGNEGHCGLKNGKLMSPVTAPSFCLERVSRMQGRDRTKVEPSGLPELRRWSEECRDTKAAQVHGQSVREERAAQRESQRPAEGPW